MATKDGRSASQRRPSGQARPEGEPRSRLRDALASASALISHFPQKFRRLSSSLRAGSRHPSTTQPRNSKAMSSLSGHTPPTGSSGPLDAILHGRPRQSSVTPDSSNMPLQGGSKENVPPPDSVVPQLSQLSLNEKPPTPKNLAIQPPNPPGRTEEERQAHQRFTNEALDMARLALRTNETPVGCVLVHNGTVVAKGMNATNVTRNGTRHAEFMAIVSLLARNKKGKTSGAANGGLRRVNIPMEDTESSSEDENPPARGHLYPYGQKLHPADVVDRSIIKECTLYVTVEPCVMCASLLRQLGIKKVFFGAVNDKFGGTGGVFSIHKNASPLDGEIDAPRGDGGSVEPGFEVEGGWGRDDAVGLLRRFYVQENGRAPVPRKKEGRAARLAALERDANNGGSTTSVTPETGEPNMAPDSVAGEAQEGQPKLDGQEEESRADVGESDPDGKVKRDQATNDESDLIVLEDKKNGADQGTPNCNGKEGEKNQADDKEAKLIELSGSDKRADEKESLNGRAAEAIPA